MADNSVLPATGEAIRTIEKTSKKTQVVTLDLGGSGAEALVAGSIPVTGAFYPVTQPVSGTFWQTTQPVSGTFWPTTQPVSGTFWQATQPVSIATMPTTAVTGTFWQATQPVSVAGTVATSIASQPLPTGASTDASLTGHAQTFKAAVPQTTLSAANTAVTLTIAAAGVGLFHYLTRIRITLHNTSAAAVAGSAVTLGFTSTNIPGSLAWTEGNALAAGASKVVVDEVLSQPIKTTTANTATTIVAPACGAGVVCRITAYYYPAA